MAQDDYFYEIQLTNKQLVFYFMAGAAGLILSFLAGVMVGRGVDSSVGAAEPTQRIADERMVAEPTPAPVATEYSYPQRLDSDHASEGLEKPAVGGASGRAQELPPRVTVTPPTTAGASATHAAAPPTVIVTPPPRPSPTPRASLPSRLPRAIGSSASIKGFAVQVGAFKDRASAETVVRSLKGRGLPAYSVAPAGGGLFTVRVGVYRDRADAEAVQGRLRDDKFKPFVFKQ